MDMTRHLWIVLLALVMAAALGLGFYTQDYARRTLVEAPAAEQNRVIANSFMQSLWLPATATQARPLCAGAECPDWSTLAAQSLFYIASTPVVRLQVFGPEGKALVSVGVNTGPLDKKAMPYFETAKNSGDTQSYVAENQSYTDRDGQYREGSLYVSYVPVRPGGGAVTEVMEVAVAISPGWERAGYLWWVAAAVVAGISLLLYLLLWLFSDGSERIIESQHEEQADLVAAKVKAEEESDQKSKFLANVSHELRTPLNSIIGFSEILKDEVMGPLGSAQYKEYATDIHASGTHLLSLINDILDFSKADANKLEVEQHETDITKLMQNCLRLVQQRAESASIALVPDFAAEHVVAETDPKRLKQVVLNLLSNAVKFTPPGGKVTLTCYRDSLNHKMVIVVRDTGVGIAEKDISKVMAPFGQVKNEYSSKSEGTGLGLPLTRKLVELMGGHFHISSKLGEGTAITLTFALPAPASNLSL